MEGRKTEESGEESGDRGKGREGVKDRGRVKKEGMLELGRKEAAGAVGNLES
jgi:hypothetical protein